MDAFFHYDSVPLRGDDKAGISLAADAVHHRR
jgi:hypothetical protein